MNGFWCSCCGQWHDEMPMDFVYPPPQSLVGTRENPLPGATITSDWCITGDREYLVRCCLNLPVIDGPRAFSYGVWSSVSEKSFHRIMELWNDARCAEELPYFSYLLINIGGYPKTWGLEATLVTHSVTDRPLLYLAPSDHPLAVEQREGITIARAQEIAEQMLHPPSAAQS